MNDIRVIAPHNGLIERTFAATPTVPFAKETRDFIEKLSQTLLNTAKCREHGELVALGYWLRASHVKRLACEVSELQKPLGTVLHFTPTNVDTMFIYSWICSLLLGNKNIVRVASNESVVKNLLLNILDELLIQPEFQGIGVRNVFISYDRTSNVSALLSIEADARVIWGGDESVKAIRTLPAKPRCRDISFANRYSATVINSEAITGKETLEELSRLLWRDVSTYDQQACSSPKVIFWLGSREHVNTLLESVDELYTVAQENTKQNELLVLRQLLSSFGGVQKCDIGKHCQFITVDKFNADLLSLHNGGSTLLVKVIDDLADVINLIDSKLQTVSYWGLEKPQLLKLIEEPSISGIDRIVPLGSALEFDHVWDGYEMLSQLSRKVRVL